ncbi:MAG TPA: hypothetical protein PLU30_06795 [Verrucomicrobiae bacterium]|nr:hypothetical protein [Verrucomicrobiae bacterium]
MVSYPRPVYRLSQALLGLVLLCVAVDWMHLWWPVLTDPGLQIDDARTHLVGYHQFERDPGLVGDPVAGACMAMQPWLVRLFYQLVTPVTGLFSAAKWAQLLCVLIALAAAVVVARSRRWGLAAGALLAAFSLVFPWWVGGTPRQFGPPLLAMYIAGTLARRPRVRYSAALLASGTYPSAAMLMLATEGLLVLPYFWKEPWRLWRARAVKFACLAAVCAAFVLLPRPGSKSLGPVIILAEARSNPDYCNGARRLNMTLSANPFSKSIREVLFVFGFVPVNPDTKEKAGALRVAAAWVGLAGVGWLVISRRVRIPISAPAFWLAGATLYWLACHLAYRLYLPNRYSEYGMGTGAIAFLIGILVQTRIPRRPAWIHRSLGNLAAAGCVAGLWLAWGKSDRFSGTANIARAPHAALYEYARSLPGETRFGSHPYDGDDIPFWAGRASLCGYELDQPFFTGSWRNSVERTRATFAALYATDTAAVITFCDRWQITHLLLRPDRYREDFRKRAKYCDPFDEENRARLRRIPRGHLVLAEPPDDAVVFRDDRFTVVEVAGLRRAWGAAAASH